MIETKDIKKIAKHIFSINRGYKRNVRLLHPERDWVIIVVSFLLFFLAGLGFSLWHLYTYQTLPDTIEGNNDTELPHFSTRSINLISEKYQTREELFLQKLETANQDSTSTVLERGDRESVESDTQTTNSTQSGEVDSPSTGTTQAF